MVNESSTVIARGYAALNVQIEGAVRGDRCSVASRAVVRSVVTGEPELAPTGGRVPVWEVVRFDTAGGRSVDVGFQIVASPRGERPALPLRPGDELDLTVDIDWSYTFVARSLDGRLRLAAGWVPNATVCSVAGLSVQAGPLAREMVHTWSHGAHMAFDGITIDVPHEGWHRVTRVSGTFDVSGLYLRAEPPSAQVTHLRFAILVCPPPPS